MSGPIKVLIVDDSAVVRQVLSELLARDAEIRVLGAASDPLFALQRMQREWPDVIVLDVEMPRMDGITFLRKIMRERPTPVVVCSTLTERGTETTMQALSAGAVDVVAKPKLGLKEFLQASAQNLAHAVKAAAKARLGQMAAAPPPVPASAPAAFGTTTDHVIAIGTSTGGTRALETVLTQLPADCPGIVIVQHMPEKFTAAFAQRLNALCHCEVREAEHGDQVLQGRVLVAPGGRHLQLRRRGTQYLVDVRDGPPVNRHKPSVDVLFHSVAKHAGRNAVGIIMTGMGDDGANGLLAMRQAGAFTIAQDEATCVVYGMPKEAVERGAVCQVLPLMDIAAAIMRLGKPS